MNTRDKASPLPHLTARENGPESPEPRISDAAVIVTHSRRYAVALEYQPGRMPAPRALACGMDRRADRVRELARQHDIPTVEDPLLAEALYRHATPGEPIPEGLYAAVARVVAYLTRLRHRQPASYVPLRQPPRIEAVSRES